MFSGPIREGNRGGQGLFKWEDVKEDKDRENYLGHSIHAPVGRWQKNRDLGWYSKKETEEQKEVDLKKEIQALKDAEADALAEALGYTGPKILSKRLAQPVSTEELKKAMKKETESYAEENPSAELVDQSGLGFGHKWLEKKETAASSSKLVSGEKSSAEAVQGVAISRGEEPESEMKSEERKSKKDKKKKDKSKKEKKKHHRRPSTERRKHKRRRSHSPEPERERDRRRSKS